MNNSPKKTLADYEGIRITFTADVAGFDYRTPSKGFLRNNTLKTIHLREIRDQDGNFLIGAYEFFAGKGFTRPCLRKGEVVRFDARVIKYKNESDTWDFFNWEPVASEYHYKLSHPSKVCRVDDEAKEVER